MLMELGRAIEKLKEQYREEAFRKITLLDEIKKELRDLSSSHNYPKTNVQNMKGGN